MVNSSKRFADASAAGFGPFPPPGPGLSAQLNAGNGTFTLGPSTILIAPFGATVSGLADLDGDALPDLAVVAAGPPEFWLLRGNGNGSFTQPGARVSFGAVGLFSQGGLLGDVDGDGRLDVVTGMGNSTFAPKLVATLNRTYTAGGPLLDRPHTVFPPIARHEVSAGIPDH